MASEGDLRAWYTASGLKGKKLDGALRASEAAEVEDVGDLRMMLGVGQLEGVFSSATLSYIMTALKASAHPEPEPEASAQLATTHRLTDHDCSSEGLLSPLGGFALLKLLARPLRPLAAAQHLLEGSPPEPRVRVGSGTSALRRHVDSRGPCTRPAQSAFRQWASVWPCCCSLAQTLHIAMAAMAVVLPDMEVNVELAYIKADQV